MVKRTKSLKQPYSAYYRAEVTDHDAELAISGHGTPCGEYLRRFWQPVALSAELKDLPVAIRILGEDLVIFRDGRGHVGVLERYCSHRNTSLEYGKIGEVGIRCCYHGWHYDVDGRILDTPGEPSGSKLKEKICHGAYPTHEYQGIVFAYMGPPEERPAFPVYDLFERPGARREPIKRHSPCNWLQVRENEMDPIHITFLHTRLFGVQFVPVFGDIPTMEWVESPNGMIYVTVRRWGDYLWLRSNEMMLPNLCRVAGIQDGEGETEFDQRGGDTNWVVPIDDTNCWSIGWEDVEEDLPDPDRDGYLDRIARAGDYAISPHEAGQTGEPSYEERQRAPADWDAWVSQGSITAHSRERLATTDTGVVMYRKLVRSGIRALKQGRRPKWPPHESQGILPTYAHNTVKRIPPAATPEAERALRLDFGRAFTGRLLAGEFHQPPAQAAE